MLIYVGNSSAIWPYEYWAAAAAHWRSSRLDEQSAIHRSCICQNCWQCEGGQRHAAIRIWRKQHLGEESRVQKTSASVLKILALYCQARVGCVKKQAKGAGLSMA